jgi:hypothetical protein
MMFFLGLMAVVVAASPTPRAFALLDVETAFERPVNRYRALELGTTRVRPVSWEVAPPAGVQYGLALVGPQADLAPAVAWDPAAATLWLDADGDRRWTRAERHAIQPGATVAIPVTIATPEPIRRTILVRPGLLGGGPRYTVRGCMAGELELAQDPGGVWSYTFSGGRDAVLDVGPEGESRANLLEGLRFSVTAAAQGDTGTRPGDDVDATPYLRLASGLFMSNCTTRPGNVRWSLPRQAVIELQGPGGAPLDLAFSGFA